jgi:hypothetical protein
MGLRHSTTSSLRAAPVSLPANPDQGQQKGGFPRQQDGDLIAEPEPSNADTIRISQSLGTAESCEVSYALCRSNQHHCFESGCFFVRRQVHNHFTYLGRDKLPITEVAPFLRAASVFLTRCSPGFLCDHGRHAPRRRNQIRRPRGQAQRSSDRLRDVYTRRSILDRTIDRATRARRQGS